MNYNCKYCDYVDKCSRKCEYDSVLCRMNRSFPKIVKRPYKDILYENSDLKLENTNLKQALNDIRKIINECKMLMSHEFCWEEQADNILQTINKVLGGGR